MKKYIRSFASTRTDVAAELESNTFPLMVALAQLYLFPNNRNENHWKGEVWIFIHEVDRFKKSNKLPTKEFILKNTWECNSTEVKSAIDAAIDKEEGEVPRLDIDLDKVRTIMSQYFDWLASKLSSSRYLSKSDVYDKLRDLGLCN